MGSIMLRHLRSLILVLILLEGFVQVSGCHAKMADKFFPAGVIIKHAANGTIESIKGDNISSSLDNDPNFILLKKNDKYVEIAYAFLQGGNKLFRINDPRKEFTAIDVKIDDLNYKRIRFQQVMENIPIWGRELSLHLNGKNQVYLAQGHYEPTLKNVPSAADISEQSAVHSSEDAVSGGKSGWKPIEITKTIFMVDDKNPRLSYKITLVKGISGKEYVFVDAMDGKILHRISGIQN